MNLKHILSITLAASAASASAQFDQNINVEGRYIPDVIRQERVGTFPKPVYFPMESSQLQFSLDGVAANFPAQAIPIPASGWGAQRDVRNHRGYLDMSLGSWLNSSLSAGYRFINTDSSSLGIRFQHNSTSLFRPELSEIMKADRRYRYDENLGIAGHHLFDGIGRLEAAAGYHLGAFNYYGYDPSPRLFASSMQEISAPTQTLQDIYAKVGWISPAEQSGLNYNANLGVRYFGYRRLYLPLDVRHLSEGDNALEALGGGRETHIYLHGGASISASESSSWGMNIGADYLGYADYKYRHDASAQIYAPDAYGLLSLNPYYRFTRSKFNVTLGAVLDFTFKAGPSDDRYSLLHVAPDVRVDYDADVAKLYLHLLGGTRLHTLAAGFDEDYYQQPAIFNTTPSHSPLDAKLGASFGPFKGFEAGIDLAFRSTRNQYFGGLYQAYLNYNYDVLPGLPSSAAGSPLQYTYLESASNISGWSVGAHLGYDMGAPLKLAFSGSYQPQSGKHGYFNGYDRPRWLLSASAETNPWSSLILRLCYEYRGVRAQPVWGYPLDTNAQQAMLESRVRMLRLPDMTMLNLGASYDLSQNLSIRIQADNILGRHTPRFFGLPEEGLRLSAGFDWVF